MSEVTENDINMIDYFIREKGDIERWSSWDERKPVIEAEYPELITALNNLKLANITLDAVVNKIIDSIDQHL